MQYGCGTLILIFFVIVMGASLFDSDEPAAPLTPEQVRTKEVERGFSAWDGSHRELTKWIKNNLKDPESYEHIETKYVDNGGDEFVVWTKYRARNSFGGMALGFASARAHIDGRVLEIITSE